MKLSVMQVGPIETNCYLVSHGSALAVVDPGDEAERILAAVRGSGAQVKYILLTHGHYDHTTAVPALHAACRSAEVWIHAADAPAPATSLFPLAGELEELHFYDEGDTLDLDGLTIRVLHTPGHSRGSVTLQAEDVLFAGDTLFAGTCGRVDLEGGSDRQMLSSLRRLGQLEGDFRVLPGHGPSTTLERERRQNAYMQMAMR